MNVMLHSANLPNKQEIDEVYKDVHTLRKRIAKLESEARKKTKPKKGTDDGNIWWDKNWSKNYRRAYKI